MMADGGRTDAAEAIRVGRPPALLFCINAHGTCCTCRACEHIGQAPTPFYVVPRGWAGPNLLAVVLFEKYGQHRPLNRQSQRYAREGVAAL